MSARVHRDWPRAVRALRALVNDPSRTELAQEISTALDAGLEERGLAELLARAEGRRLFRERPLLGDVLCDRAALERLPEDSFGRAYLAHLDRHGLDPGKLVEIGRTHGPSACMTDPDLRWWRERGELAHDLWHVLSGYGADPLGEAALLPFSLAQTGGRANALLALGATLEAVRRDGLRALARAWRAWRRGRRAVCLSWLRYEELLPLPLDEVRARCRVEPLTPWAGAARSASCRSPS